MFRVLNAGALSTTPKLARAPRGTERRREQRALNFSAPTWFYWAAINRVFSRREKRSVSLPTRKH